MVNDREVVVLSGTPITPCVVSICPILYLRYPLRIIAFPAKSNTYLFVWVGIGIAEGNLSERPLIMDPSLNQIRLLTLAEAASVLHVSTRTLQRMIRNHDLPARKVGGQWRLRETLLMEWIERRGVQAIQVKPSQTE